MAFVTERLILRPWCLADADELYKQAKNPNIGPICGWAAHKNVEESREILQKVLMVEDTYAIALKETPEIAVGCISLMEPSEPFMASENAAELGYWLGESYWGQGLIPEAARALIEHAFTEKKREALWCGFYEGNEKSQRVQIKCGFKPHRQELTAVPAFNTQRLTYFSLLTRADWEQLKS